MDDSKENTAFKHKWCLCKHPKNKDGKRVFNAGAYPEDGFWLCAFCKGVIPMTSYQKTLFEELSNEI